MRLLKIKQQYIILTIIGGCMVFFQNCGQQMSFQESGDALFTKNGDITLVDDSSQIQSTSTKDIGFGEDTEEESSNDSQNQTDESLVNSQYYRCVVAGPGKSRHIGFIEEKASKDINTPDTLCMSKKACLEIMASVFDVKEAKYTGYCKNNKAHTIRINDAQAANLVAELME